MGGSDVRLNWYGFLDKAEKGTELSGKIAWGFSSQDLLILCCFHEADLFRQKIEDLLEDCNFHYENGLMHEGKYDECRKEIIKEMQE